MMFGGDKSKGAFFVMALIGICQSELMMSHVSFGSSENGTLLTTKIRRGGIDKP